MSVIIFGASGLVGTAAIDAFAQAGHDVIAVSRRTPEPMTEASFTHVSLDLFNGEETQEKLSRFTDITHVVYAAVHELPDIVRGWRSEEQMAANLTMIKNALQPIIRQGNLQHVTLLQGTKAYGVHLHPIRVPSRESEPRDNHENFYWLQEDLIRELSERHGFNWTIFRPPLIVGPNYGVAMNLVPVIGAYAAIRHAEGKPLSYPGGPSYVAEMVDVELLANAIVWASHAPTARNEHFNITNGEVFQWRDLWSGIAQTLGVELGEDEPMSVSRTLAESEALWQEIVQQYGLRNLTIQEIVGTSHRYADFQFAAKATEPPPPALMSTVKLNQAGFTQVANTEQSFTRWLKVLVDRRVIPAFTE